MVTEARRSPTLVDRDAELARLARLLERAADGQPTTLFLRGEVGVGKSRLLTEFVAHARATGAQVLWGSCIALGEGEIPYAPIVEALRHLARELEMAGARELPSAYTNLTALISDQAEPLPARSPQSRVFGAVLRLLDQLGSDRPIVLVLEDLQWSDPSTLDLVAYLARVQSDERLLLIGSYRTTNLDPLHPLWTLTAELERARRVEQLEVMSFGRTGLKFLLRALSGSEPSHDLVERTLELTDGNPFFVEELYAAGVLTAPEGVVELPRSVRSLVVAQIARLGPDARAVLRAAATAGRRLSHGLLAAVVDDMPERQLSAALRECVDSQILVVHRPDGTYAFRHALLREVVHDDLMPGERTALHGAVAAALAADHTLGLDGPLTVAAELSYHFFEAEAYPQAFTSAIEAGQQAARILAFREAGRQYARALAVWDILGDNLVPDTIVKARVLIEAADVERWAGRIDRAVQLARAAVSEVDTGRDPELGGEMYERLGSLLWEAGDHSASDRAYAAATELLADASASAVAARVLIVQASALVRDGHYVKGLAIGRAGLEMARSVSARAEEGRALNWIGGALFMAGHVDEGEVALREAIRIAESEHQLEDLYRAYGNLAYVLENAGLPDRSLMVALEGMDRLRHTGGEHTYAYGTLANNACASMVQLGQWDEATSIIDELLPSRSIAESLFPRLTLAEIETNRGNVDLAARLLAEVREAGGSIRQPQFVAFQHIYAAEAAAWAGAHEEARDAVATGLQAIEGTEHSVVHLRLCATGLRNEADEWQRNGDNPGHDVLSTMDKLMAVVERSGEASDQTLPEVAALAQLCRAEGSRAQADPGPSLDAWSALTAMWQERGRPYPAAYAQWRWAEAAVRFGDKGQAHTAAREAYATADYLGAGPLRAAVVALARRARLNLSGETNEPSTAPPEDPYRLTPREREILALVCTGRTNLQIGRSLSISEKTVSVHVSRIMQKLNVRNRTAAVLKASEIGLVSPSFILDTDAADEHHL